MNVNQEIQWNRINLLLLVGLVLYSTISLIEASDVFPGMIVYTDQDTCPTGFKEIGDNKRGRAILSDPGSSAGSLVGSAYTTPTQRTHSHSMASMCFNTFATTTTSNVGGIQETMYSDSQPSVCSGDQTITNTDAPTGYAFAFLRACVAVTVVAQVPKGTVAHFDTTVPTCPNGWTKYSTGNGRFTIPLSATQQAPSGRVESKASAFKSGAWSDNINDMHYHDLFSSYKFPETALSECCSNIANKKHFLVGGAPSGLSGSTSKINAIQQEIPWVSLLTCIATIDNTDKGEQILPKRTMIFMDPSTCTEGYERANSSYNGRIILTNPIGIETGTLFGGTPFNPPEDVSHNHRISGIQLKISGTTTSIFAESGDLRVYKLGARTIDLPTFTSTNANSKLPYVALALCQSKGPKMAISARGRWVRLNLGRSQINYQYSVSFSISEGQEVSKSTIDSFAESSAKSSSHEYSKETYLKVEAGLTATNKVVSASVGVTWENSQKDTDKQEITVQHSKQTSNGLSSTIFSSITQTFTETVSIGCGNALDLNLFVYEFESPGIFKSIPKPIISWCKVGSLPPLCPPDHCADNECTFCKPGTFNDTNFDILMSQPKFGEFMRANDPAYPNTNQNTIDPSIIGISVGVPVGCILIAAVIFTVIRKRRSNHVNAINKNNKNTNQQKSVTNLFGSSTGSRSPTSLNPIGIPPKSVASSTVATNMRDI